MVEDLKYFKSLKNEVKSIQSQLETQKTQFSNDVNRLSREYYYADHINAILDVYTKLDEVTNLQCDYLEALEKYHSLENEFSKRNTKSTSFEALQQHAINLEIALQQYLKAQLQDKNIAISELKKLIDKIKEVSFSTGVIPTTSVSRPQLKSNRLEDRVLHNNSQWKKKKVEDHRRIFKFSNNKTSVTACNDSLNVKTSNVNFVCVTCGKCVLHDNHDMCVLHYINGVNSRTKKPIVVPISTREPKRKENQSVVTTHKKIVASEPTIKKPKSIFRKLYEHVSKTCSWWYPKLTPLGYKWKPKTTTRNVKPNDRFPQGIKSRTSNISKQKTLRGCTLSNTPLSSNSFAACTVKFENDQIAPILSYGDLVQGNITIKRVYYVEGLNHNLFSVGQFCDVDLEVAFRKSICYVRDLKGNDLLTGSRGSDLYSITLQDTYSLNPTCLMAKASSSQAWLWHRRLSHLNFDTINLLSKNDIVIGLLKLKFVKDHLCSSCELGKAQRKSFKTKTTPSSKRRLQLLHMDLCGPMRVESINGKKYMLVIVDDYSRYTWTHFLRSKDETPKVLIAFLILVQRGFHAQNDVVERRNRTLLEAARTMLSAAKVPLFFWSEAIATTCFTQNRSLVIPRHEKTPYHIINGQKPSVKFFHIFGSLCYIVRDGENLDKTKEKGDVCIFVGYSTVSRGYRVYNKRTRLIVETIHVNFDELPQIASDHISSNPDPQCLTTALEHGSLSFASRSQVNVPQIAETSFVVPIVDASDKRQQQNTTSSTSTTVVVDSTPLNIQTTPEPSIQVTTQVPTITTIENNDQVEIHVENAHVEEDEFINIFSTLVHEVGELSSRHVDSSNMHTLYQRHPSEHYWTREHPLEQLIGNPSQPVRTRRQLDTDGEICMFALTVIRTEPNNIKEAMADLVWIEAMQEELHQFE
ncbi:retrovirus-related pol polyprotein from transposon TNT 1-94 [Tanacetum coccineum]